MRRRSTMSPAEAVGAHVVSELGAQRVADELSIEPGDASGSVGEAQGQWPPDRVGSTRTAPILVALHADDDSLNQFASEDPDVLNRERAAEQRSPVHHENATERHRILHREATIATDRLLQARTVVAPQAIVPPTRAPRVLSVALLAVFCAGITLGASGYGGYWFVRQLDTARAGATDIVRHAAPSPVVLAAGDRRTTAETAAVTAAVTVGDVKAEDRLPRDHAAAMPMPVAAADQSTPPKVSAAASNHPPAVPKARAAVPPDQAAVAADQVTGRTLAVARPQESVALLQGDDKATARGRPAQDQPAYDRPATALILPVTDGAFSPSFATTGSGLFFHSGREQAGRLLEANLDDHGAPLRVVSVLDGQANHHPRVSPDDHLIAFDSERDGERGVYVADRVGTNVRRVSGPGFAAFPSWSPDMKWLAFVRAEPGHPKVWNLWLRDMGSGELRRLTSYRIGQTWTASWFPDAHRLSYSHEDQLVVLDVATGATQILASPLAGKLVRTPAVSPDGKRIVFQVFRHGVWIVDLATHAMRQILEDPTAEEFAWNPLGSRLAYHSRKDGEWRIWVTAPPS